MQTIEFKKIIYLSILEIKEEIEKQIKEIIDYIDNNEISENLNKIFQEDINSLKYQFNILFDFKNNSIDSLSLENIDSLIRISKELKKPLKIFIKSGEYSSVLEESIPMLFKDSTINKFNNINEYLISKGEKELFFLETDGLDIKTWSIKEIISANDRINKSIKRIRENNLSPLEAVYFIHRIVTNTFVYNEDEIDPISARSIIGVLNSDKIVCVGYASLVKSLIDKLEYEDLMCETVTVKVERETDKNNELSEFISNGEGHMFNVVHVHDDKYDVDGVYVLDATYDSKRKGNVNGEGFACCMFPIMDLLNYRGITIKQYDNSIDELLALSGIEADCPLVPPIVEKYQDNSKPISFDNVYKCLESIYSIMFANKDSETISRLIENTIDYSMMVSQKLFLKSAINSIRQEAEKYEFE